MKKRLFMVLSMIVLCAVCCCALADEVLGAAVIRAGGNGKVHLRQEPSITAASLGLYYSGTEVDVLSDPDGSWVKVGLGRVRGYIHSDYLVYGEEAEDVVPAWPVGIVSAKNFINIRKGPSTEYQLAGTAASGQEVAILGETYTHWYYILADGVKGYASARMIEMTDETSSAVRSTFPWKAAYRAFLLGQGDIGASYSLIYVNGDDTPELVIDTGAEARGAMILAYNGQDIDVLQLDRRGFTYIEKKNLLSNSDGVQDVYYDRVYVIRNGKWIRVFSGDYHGYKDGWNEEQGRYVCQTYMVDGQETTMEAYLKAYASIYNEKRAVKPEAAYSYDGIMEELR